MQENTSYMPEKFHPAVRQWFTTTYENPTAIQQQAWATISQGKNTLVVAPTGSGKTLAAFLWAIQDLLKEKTEDISNTKALAKKQVQGVKVLYISPLKALGADVEKNLRIPLEAIESLWLKSSDHSDHDYRGQLLQVAMRTGDTTPDERRKIAAHPPDILITTPESLYLMLTSQAASVLKTVQTVIVDEIHSLAPNKRGAHLSLSLERLDALLETPAQRIGLSATVNPVSKVATYLGGIHDVTVVQDTQKQEFDLNICVPVADMAAVPINGGTVGLRSSSQKSARLPRSNRDVWKTDRALKAAMAAKDEKLALPKPPPDSVRGSSSLWPYIESTLLDEILAHRSTIVFVNSRGLCERLTARLNELYGKRQGLSSLSSQATGANLKTADGTFSAMRSEIGGTSQLVNSADSAEQSAVIAKAHHGSVSKEKRLRVEAELKSGQLRCVVATSSLELGIDMGSVDLVLQVAPPLSVASGLQRIGRANHQVDGRSQAIIFPRTRLELLDSVVMAKAMQEGKLESIELVENALDVLAQQTIAAVSQASYEVSDWYAIVRKSACYHSLSEKAFREVIAMVSGYYSRGDLSDFAPRIDWDRETDKLTARANTQRLAVSGAGTIPDRGLYPVILPEGVGKAGRKRVGELDEEMVHESRVGDVIALGTSSWRIKEITADRVMVEPAPGHIARLPFWHGEQPSRSFDLGQEKGAFVRELVSALKEAASDGHLSWGFQGSCAHYLEGIGLDSRGQRNLAALLKSQQAATTWVPTDQALVIEHCQDEMGQWRIFLHSPFGKAVHEPWALVVSWRVQTLWGYDPCALASDDGIMLQIPLTETTFPDKSIFVFDPEEVAHIVRTQVDSTALYAARFRECAMRSLLMSPTPQGKRAPLWQQRLKAGQLLEGARREQGFPLLAEAARECLADVYNLDALQQVQTKITAGAIELHDVTTTVPSPFAASLIFAYVGEHLYDPDKPKSVQQTALLSLDTSLLVELLGSTNFTDLIDEEVVNEVTQQLQRINGANARKGPEAIEILLQTLGPLTTDELSERLSGCDSAEMEQWLHDLAQDKRILAVTQGSSKRWAQMQDLDWIRALTSAVLPAWVNVGKTYTPEQTQKLLNEELIRYGRTHGAFSAEDISSQTGIAVGIVEMGLQDLETQGVFMNGVFLKNLPESTWIHRDVFARLRTRSLAAARRAVEPVAFKTYLSQVFALQGVSSPGLLAEGSDALLEVIARFEGCSLPTALWEETIFPARLQSYKPASLDLVLESGDVFWQQSEDALAFYPGDSPYGPQPLDGFHEVSSALEKSDVVSPMSVGQAIVATLSQKGPLLYDEVMRQIALIGDYADQEVVSALSALCAQGALSNDSYAFVRAQATEDLANLAKAASTSTSASKPVSRRGRLSLSGARLMKKEARNTVLARSRQAQAVMGHWFLLEPPRASHEEIALAAVESVLDLYGVISPDTVKLSGVRVEWATLSKVLHTMEEAGVLVRGCFVEELGPVQYAQKELVEVLQENATHSAQESRNSEEAPWITLPANDPAQVYGILASWPDPAESLAQHTGTENQEGSHDAEESQRLRIQRSKDWLIVFQGGEVLLAVMATFKASYVFSDSRSRIKQAIEQVLQTIQLSARQKGESLSRKKIVAKTINGKDVFGTPYAELLTECGFVSLPDGLRYYPQPF